MARSLFVAALAIAAAAPLAGCADAVDPTVGTAQAFSVYGYLDPTADRQALRVVPIEATLGADTTAAVDAAVTSVEPATGRTAAWRDSAVTFRDGSVGHVFVADYTPTAGAAIEVTVRASDGRRATVAVETPPLARPTVGPALPDVNLTTYPVTVAGVPRVIAGTLRLFVTGRPGAPGTSTIDVPTTSLRIRNEGDAWTVDVPFLEATRDRLQELGLSGGALTLVEAEFAPFVANAAWAVPPGGFDEDAVVEPGTFSNVAGGFGFVGAGYRAPVRWVPSTNAQARAGFAVTNDPAAQVAINEVGDGYVELFNPTAEPIDVSGYLLVDATPGGGEAAVPSGSLVSPGTFLVVDGPFDAVSGALIQLLTSSRRLLKITPVGEGYGTWGAYPDGFSYRTSSTVDLFYGPVRRTPGGPNRPDQIPFIINEVSTSGDGYVEVRALPVETEEGVSTDPRGALLWSSREGLESGPAVVATGTSPFLVASEGGALVLNQLGGSVFVMVSFPVADTFDLQVVDARFYGPQVPGQSTGYLPDGPGGAWSEGLRPTRGAPNVLARFGL